MSAHKVGRWPSLNHALAAVLLPLLACGGGGGGGLAGGPGGEDGDLVTLGSLGEGEKQEFEAWKRRPLKACAWSEAFPELARTYPDADGSAYTPSDPLIDVDRFVEHLEQTSDGLPVLQGAGGELVLFDRPSAATSWEYSSRSSTRLVNGRGTVFKATAERDNGECVITLGGEEVFRGFLADHLPAAAAYDPQAPLAEAVKLGTVDQKTDGGMAIGRMDGTPLVSAAMKGLAPGDGALAFLAEHFGVSGAQSRSLFEPSAADGSAPGAASLLSATGAGGAVDLSHTTVFAAGHYLYDAERVPDTSVLSALRTPGTVRLDLFFLPALPADGLVRLEATLAVTTPTSDPVAQLTSIALGAEKVRADADAVGCFLARHAASAPWTTTTVKRTYQGSYGPCRILSPQPSAALASSPDSIAAVVGEVGARGSKATSYQGWDGALVDLVDAMLTRGQPLSTLDPQGKVSALAARTADLATTLDAVGDADARRALQRRLVSLAFDPYFTGRTPTAAQRADVAGALARASKPFLESTARMLDDLVAGDRAAGFRAAACGAALTDARIAAVEETIAGAAGYEYGKGYAGRLRAAALQQCYTQGDLDQVAAAVAAARDLTGAEESQDHSIHYKNDHQGLVDHALDERWGAAEYANAREVMGFAVVSEYGYCGTYATLSEQAWCAAGGFVSGWQDWLSAAPGGGLDPAFGGRYAVLARELRGRFLDQLADDFSTRADLELAYFDDGGLWRSCGGDGYAARRNELFRLLDELEAATSVSERVDVVMALDDLLRKEC